MGYVTNDSGENTDGPATHGSPSPDWAMRGIITTYVLAITATVMMGGMTMFAMRRDWTRFAGNGQSFTMTAPAMQPGDFARSVEARAAALAAQPKDLDLRVAVDAWPEMSAEHVADQATELALRLRCRVDVRYKGQTVQVWPGMSRESFLKEYLEQVESDAGRAGERP